MRHLMTTLMTIFVLAAMTVPAMATTGTREYCETGCLPGNNACSNCCGQLGEACFKKAVDMYKKRLAECDFNDAQCKQSCWNQLQRDERWCGEEQKYTFQCPDWVDPEQKCPYDCQKWNPASRTCVGAKMNGCN